MGATVDDVEGGNGQDKRLLGTGQIGKVDKERNVLFTGTSLGNGDGDTKDGIGTKLALVGGTIKLQHKVVNGLLVNNVEARVDKSGTNDLDNILNSLEDTYSYNDVEGMDCH
jgi:hypothetical protein